jgi:pyrroline-5-carboxylate reductase
MEQGKEHTLLLIGGGNMGAALAHRWAAWKPILVEPSPLRRAALKDDGFVSVESLAEVHHVPQVVVLAVKPQTYPEIKSALAKLAPDALIVSIMAGVPLAKFALGARAARVMPNTPAALGQGMSVCYGPTLNEEDQFTVNDLFAACGEVSWITDENVMHAITAISGSGPAYVFAFMEALENAATKLGIDPVTAHTIVKQTVLGSVAMTNVPFADFALLREQVTSKGGTTEAALAELLPKLPKLVELAASAAAERSKSLASQ